MTPAHTHTRARARKQAEAIAIVCSVKYRDTQVFRCTTPHGLATILNCKKEGFHPHDEPRDFLFEKCAHATFDPALPFVVKDFRT